MAASVGSLPAKRRIKARRPARLLQGTMAGAVQASRRATGLMNLPPASRIVPKRVRRRCGLH
jgi:hypothetical protein